jgi:multiple sugar transport system ATP-binding protein
MDGIRLEATTKVYPNGVKAIDNVTLDIRAGEFMVLVGPSGCGKSTLLRMIAGLEEVTEGRILIGDRDVTRLRPRDRDIAMVFQNYALYPQMTVEENLGFGLKLRRVPKVERTSRVDQVADTLGLKALLKRRPAFLSGGQRQRVAMGRAMVREPKAFLMDEPLSNLDAKLRVAMRGELTRLHDRLGVTTVYVTHDQVEAMTLGQRVAVMLDGVLQQCDTPQKLFHQPTNLFVAAFMGSPAMNVVEAEVADGEVRFAGLTVPLAQGSPLAGANRTVILGIRPTDLRPPDEAPAGLPVITVRPDQIEELGGLSNLLFPLEAPRVQTDATRAAVEATGDDDATLLADDLRARFCATIDGRREVQLGEEIELAVDHQYLHFFDPVSGLAITSADGAAATRGAAQPR